MNKIVTIDTGTTNTRAVLWDQDTVTAEDFEPVGVRNTAISGSKKQLKQAVKKAIDKVLGQADIKDHRQVTVISSGMITSDLGLVEVPHIKAPAGLTDLAQGLVKENISDVFDQPIWFIPGVKNSEKQITPQNIMNMDIMRGEEVETIGALSQIKNNGNTIIILPGSHTKIIKVDDKGKIEGSITSITGELLELLTKNSILADSLDADFTESLDEEALSLGAQACAVNGIGRTAFSVRLLGMFTDYSRNQRANYLLGAVLENDIKAIKNTAAFSLSEQDDVIIVGKKALSGALETLIQNDNQLKGTVETKDISHLAGLGAIEIAKAAKII